MRGKGDGIYHIKGGDTASLVTDGRGVLGLLAADQLGDC